MSRFFLRSAGFKNDFAVLNLRPSLVVVCDCMKPKSCLPLMSVTGYPRKWAESWKKAQYWAHLNAFQPYWTTDEIREYQYKNALEPKFFSQDANWIFLGEALRDSAQWAYCPQFHEQLASQCQHRLKRSNFVFSCWLLMPWKVVIKTEHLGPGMATSLISETKKNPAW